MFADVMSVVAFAVAATALIWQIKTEYRNEPVITVKLTQDYDKEHGTDFMTLTAINWGRSDVTIKDKGLRLFNGLMVDGVEWMGSRKSMPRRLQSHSSTEWHLCPKQLVTGATVMRSPMRTWSLM